MHPFPEVHCPVALLAYCQQFVAETKPVKRTTPKTIRRENTPPFKTFSQVLTTTFKNNNDLSYLNLLPIPAH